MYMYIWVQLNLVVLGPADFRVLVLVLSSKFIMIHVQNLVRVPDTILESTAVHVNVLL